MFTGLVEAVGHVGESVLANGGVRLSIATSLAGGLSPGDSIAVNGVCLTVVTSSDAEFRVDVGPETLNVTTLGSLARDAKVNLERPLRVDSRLGGHFVQGHVDGVGRIEDLRAAADFHWLTVGFPANLAPFVVHRGSVAVDGISLTIARLHRDRFDIQVVPFTLDHTNLMDARRGTAVNLECDMVGKYVARAVELAGLAART
jgi:riboflavin synthase